MKSLIRKRMTLIKNLIQETRSKEKRMNKEEILQEIEKTKEHLGNMEKMLKECEYERWKPKENETYFYVASSGTIEQDEKRDGFIIDDRRYNFYNCFPTKEQAKLEAEKILVRRQLEDIARRLNKGRKIDWLNSDQYKYSLHYSFFLNKICITYNISNKEQGSVCCLDDSFLNVAIQEIGEERLKKYLKGE